MISRHAMISDSKARPIVISPAKKKVSGRDSVDLWKHSGEFRTLRNELTELRLNIRKPGITMSVNVLEIDYSRHRAYVRSIFRRLEL